MFSCSVYSINVYTTHHSAKCAVPMGGWSNRHFRPPVSALILFQNSNLFDFHTFDKKRCTYLQDLSYLNPTARTQVILNLRRFNHPPIGTQTINGLRTLH